MSEWLVVANAFVAGIGALFAILVFLRVSRRNDERILQGFLQLVRGENDRARQAADDHARNLRQELNDNLRGFQETTLKGFRELGDVLATQIKEFGTRLDIGLKQIDDRTSGIRTKLDSDIAHRLAH